MTIRFNGKIKGYIHGLGKIVEDPLNEKNMTAAEKQRALAAARVKGQIAAARESQRLKKSV